MSGRVETFRLVAKCSPSQHRRLREVFGMCAEMYNALLESWRGTRRWWLVHHNPDVEKQPSVSYAELCRLFTGVREDRLDWDAVSVEVGRGVLRRFDRARQGFYDRCQKGQKPGFPRFKSRHRWRSVEITNPKPSMVCAPGQGKNRSDRWWRLRVKGLPQLRFADRQHRLATALGHGAKVVEIRVVSTPIRVEVHAVVRYPNAVTADEPAVVVRPVGLDKGLKSRVTTSDGEHIPARVVDRTRIRRAQRAVSRAVKGSKTRRKKVAQLARVWRHQKERGLQADFRLAHRLVTTYDAVMVEDLAVAAMLRSKRWSRKLSEQRWSALDKVLEYKAGKAGIWHERVDPRNTSTDCSQCGHRQAMPLDERVFDCQRCGMVLDRDHNAAKNICARGTYPRARAGQTLTRPVATRTTNFCQETEPAPARGTQTDVAEPYTKQDRPHHAVKPDI